MRTLLALAFLLLSVPALAGEVLLVPVLETNLPLYNSFVVEKGGDPVAITDYASQYANRVVVEMVLVQQALRLGGMDAALHFYSSPNPARARADVVSGKAALLSGAIWKSAFDESVYMTDTVLGDGEFLKVVVGRADNKALMGVKTLEGLRTFSAVTGSSWHVDQQTLKGMGISNVTLAPRYALQIAMLQGNRCDFGLFEYPNAMEELPAELAVVPGITVGLSGSRHFMVSRRHPAGERVFQALQKGLAILESRGVLQKAYVTSGFHTPLLHSWTKIYPSGSSGSEQ